MQVQCILMQILFAVVFPSHICAFSFFDKDQNPHPQSAKAFLRKMTSFSNYQVFPFKLFCAKAKNGPNAHKNGFMETPLVLAVIGGWLENTFMLLWIKKHLGHFFSNLK